MLIVYLESFFENVNIYIIYDMANHFLEHCNVIDSSLNIFLTSMKI